MALSRHLHRHFRLSTHLNMGAAIFPTRPWGPPSSRESLFEKRGTHRQTLRYQCAARCTRNTTEPCSRDPAAASECPLAHRRHVLQAASAGAMYSLAGRLISSADSASATSPTSSLDSLARQLEERVHEFTLANGMRFIVSERRAAPVVSFHTYADVGAYDEVEGQTGVAHFLEHLAFKGTPRVGTRDFVKEAPLLDAMDEGKMQNIFLRKLSHLIMP